jgi:hypothetical protein
MIVRAVNKFFLKNVNTSLHFLFFFGNAKIYNQIVSYECAYIEKNKKKQKIQMIKYMSILAETGW